MNKTKEIYAIEKQEVNGLVCVMRHAHHDWLQVDVGYENTSGFNWDYFGADKTTHRDPRVYCYIPFEIACNTGLIRHSRRSHSGYDVKVCVSLKHTDPKIRKEIKNIVGKRPQILSRI